jgi:hypothetical protein
VGHTGFGCLIALRRSSPFLQSQLPPAPRLRRGENWLRLSAERSRVAGDPRSYDGIGVPSGLAPACRRAGDWGRGAPLIRGDKECRARIAVRPRRRSVQTGQHMAIGVSGAGAAGGASMSVGAEPASAANRRGLFDRPMEAADETQPAGPGGDPAAARSGVQP